MKIELIQKISPHSGWHLEARTDDILVHYRPYGRTASIVPIDLAVELTFARLLTICHVSPVDLSPVCSEDQVTTLADGTLALFAARHWPELVGPNGDLYHVVLAHAFPLAFLRKIFSHTQKYLPAIVREGQLRLLPRQQLTLVETVGASRDAIERKHRQVLETNEMLVVSRTGSVDHLLSDWLAFCHWRFGQVLEAEHLNLLQTLFCNEGFTVKEFWLNQVCVARSLIYVDVSQRVLLDVLAPWSQTYAHHRPGIYTAIHNLLEAHGQGLRYCLCYGRFPYKEIIVEGLPASSF